MAQNTLGNFQKVLSTNGNELRLSTNNATVAIEFCTPQIVRFRTSWNKQFEANEPWMVNKYDWGPVPYQLIETKNNIEISTHILQLQIQKQPFAIQILDKQGNLLSSEANLNSSAQSGAFSNNETIGSVKKLMPDEHFFGFGERMDFLDRRGKKVSLNVGRGVGLPHIVGAYNVLEANYSPIPFFMSTKGYGIFFHNAHPTTWDMGLSNSDTYTFEAEGGELDYYFIYGPTFNTILDGYTSITGKSPLLPKFALGLQVGTYSGGTWGHESETSTEYVVDLVKKFRELEIPLDVLHLDSTWRIFGENGGKGATTFEWRETFDKPEKMFSDLYDLNLNMVGVHLRPRFDNGKTLRLLDVAREKGLVYPEQDNPGEFVNFFNQKAVDWWWENGVKRIAEQGARFLKTDEGSAFGHQANESDKTGPLGEEIKSLHNLFPLAYAKAPYEKFQEFNKIRGMNHTREGYAGIQRYPFIFAGDWPSEWQYFEPVIKAGLNIGLSGVGNWAHCMGGFEHVADPELYIRWCQFGLLSPIAHLFGMEHPNYKEPWNYGEEALRIFKQYDELRYSLIPYLYSTAYEMYTSGKPIMRALVLDYQNDKNVYEITDQYMLGKNLMVCPITTKGAKTRVVYLPEGKWINYWTNEPYDGKQYISVLCPLDQIPIFIKSGAIIPSQQVVNYIGEKKIDTIHLDIYPLNSSNFLLYDDDGKSLEYLKGKYAETLIEVEDSNLRTEIKVNAPKGLYNMEGRSFSFKVHLQDPPKEVYFNNKKVGPEDSNTEGKPILIHKKNVLLFTISPKNKEYSVVLKK
ncbi:glycoside hydrolase family 31 protein [Arenibacter sp. M-2]|uniref:glycoside hydrolase family 31 protein n=1 Tax=Arenibacter sp. M-2 TaxID=3053612 RepID=UPI0025708987|nr:TIM-barrel domain-containing protein [Arenibacter sp. M-2]MDL5513327.1 glycoside hydrolase family 31 protein [Arenibacter sp. M-2]